MAQMAERWRNGSTLFVSRACKTSTRLVWLWQSGWQQAFGLLLQERLFPDDGLDLANREFLGNLLRIGRLVLGQSLEPPLGQIGLIHFEQRRGVAGDVKAHIPAVNLIDGSSHRRSDTPS